MIIATSQSQIFWIYTLMRNGRHGFVPKFLNFRMQRQKRYVEELGLPVYDAKVLTVTKEMADFFEATVNGGADAKLASNWIMGDVSAYLNAEQKELDDVAVNT